MKYLKLIAMSFIFIFSGCSLFSNNPKENFINLCMINKNQLKLVYLDSSHGIKQIYAIKEKDTLRIKISVSFLAKQNDYLVHIPSGVNYICYGNKKVRIVDISVCKKSNYNIKEFKKVDSNNGKNN
jgi:hypothetical protein